MKTYIEKFVRICRKDAGLEANDYRGVATSLRRPKRRPKKKEIHHEKH